MKTVKAQSKRGSLFTRAIRKLLIERKAKLSRGQGVDARTRQELRELMRSSRKAAAAR